jgi:hypothetical protein
MPRNSRTPEPDSTPLAELEINGPGEEGNPAEQDDGNQDNQPPSQPSTPDSRSAAPARLSTRLKSSHNGPCGLG